MSAYRGDGLVATGYDMTFAGPPGATIPPTVHIWHLQHPWDRRSDCLWRLEHPRGTAGLYRRLAAGKPFIDLQERGDE